MWQDRSCGLECDDCEKAFETSIVHVDLDLIETERNIVHVHEDLSVKSTMRA